MAVDLVYRKIYLYVSQLKNYFMKKEDDDLLLQKAKRHFVSEYGKPPEEAGLKCVKIWYKPIMGFNLKINRYPEVVFAPGEKEANALVQVQTIIRQGLNFTIRLLLLCVVLLPFLLYFSVKYNTFVPVVCFCGFLFAVAITFAVLPSYLKPKEELYKDKVVTYMDA